MSAKHLARLRAQQELQPVKGSNSSTEEEYDEPEPAQLKFNPFDLIQDEEDSADEAATSPPASPPVTEAAPPAQPAAQPRQQQQIGRKAAGKQQGKQKGGKAPAKAPAGGKAGGGKAGGGKAAKAAQLSGEDADIDQLLKDLNMAPGQAQVTSAKEAAADKPPLLAVSTKLLKGDDELRRIFGSSIIAEEAREARQEGQRRGRLHGRTLKKGLLVTPRPHWPPLSGGLSMEVTGMTDSGRQMFAYTHSAGYTAAQAVFEEAQASHDPNAVAELLHQTPYHTDALLAMSQLYRSMGEHSTADDMLDRCLYAFEMAWHHSFNIATANCMLDPEREENKGFFEALFRHLQGLSRRGLHRPALEVAKLLLTLDWHDPTGMLFYLDFLAVCARAYEFFQRFIAEWDTGRSILLLPNWAFSLALVTFQQAQQPSSKLDVSPEEAADEASEDLSRAVAVFPLAVKRLMARLNDQGVGRGLEWQALLGAPHFADADDCGSATYNHMVDLFVERHHQLWKPQDVQDWLRDVCKHVVSAGAHSGVPLAEWGGIVTDAFPPGEPDRVAHLRTQDFGDTTAVALPPEEVQAAMQAQAQERQAADARQQVLQQLRAQLQAQGQDPAQAEAALAALGNAAGGGEVNVQDMGVIEALLRSLAPWFDAGGGPPAAAEGGAEAGGAAAGDGQ